MPGGTLYHGLYGEVPPKRGKDFTDLEVSNRLLLKYIKGRKISLSFCKRS